LPYHIAKTPSYFAPSKSATCCEPQTAGDRELLVHARSEMDVVFLEVLARLPQRLVETPERRAAISPR
jgi:hypothetical protein